MEFIRDYAMYAAIFGFFGMVWFGWAQEKPPKQWRVWLGLGSVACVLCAIAGIYLAATHWQDATALAKSDYPIFGITVGVEVLTAGLGAFILSKKQKAAYIPAWIAFVVGAHFLPLVFIFDDPWLYVLTALACAVPVGAVLAAKRSGLAVSALVGVGMGVVLLVFALRGLFLFFAA